MCSAIMFYIKIDNQIILENNTTLNEESIISTVKSLEKKLIANGAGEKKIKDVFEISIELLQNILNYSYGSRQRSQNQKKEADGLFQVFYNSNDDIYIINSSNLITESQEITLREKLSFINNLNKNDLKILMRDVIKTQSGQHSLGAGIGLILMARKSLKPLNWNFEKLFGQIVKFSIEVQV